MTKRLVDGTYVDLEDGAASVALVSTGSFTAVSNGAASELLGSFNITISGTYVATIQLQRSFDGVTWYPVSRDTSGTAMQFTAPASLTWSEIEPNVQYRLACTTYVSGTAAWRISQ